jgi:hypothetical protein
LTIVAAVKTRDCLVLGTDSVSTIIGSVGGQNAALKSYSHTQKLFEISKYNLGVATWGQGAVGGRSIAGLVSEFSASLATSPTTVQDAAVQLDRFVSGIYNAQFSAVPVGQQPNLGFWVGGYSTGVHSPELWELNYPVQPPTSASAPAPTQAAAPPPTAVKQTMASTFYGAGWNGIMGPFYRILKGYDPAIVTRLQQAGVPQTTIDQAIQGMETAIYFDSMPVQDAIDYCRHILNVTIGDSRFRMGTPLTGEPLQVALITERNPFKWVDELSFHT